MKVLTVTVAMILLMVGTSLSAQYKNHSYDNYGHTLNIGLGVGGYSGYYDYGYNGHTLAAFNVNYEFQVAKNFTLAPFITLYSYSDPNYTTWVTPIGVKGSYYLDQLLHANPHWNFYVGASLGVALVSTTWNADYYGDRSYYTAANPLYVDFHLGTEYRFNKNIGAFLDLSTGISTIGIAIH